MKRAVWALLLANVASGCGATRQYFVPLRPDGRPAWEPRGKVVFDLCGTCYLDTGGGPARHGDLEVSVGSIQRAFGWLLVVPLLPFENNYPPGVQAYERPPPGRKAGLSVFVRVKNVGRQPVRYDFGRAKFLRDGTEVDTFAHDPLPAGVLKQGETVGQGFWVKGWSVLGGAFTVDLARAFETATPVRVGVERFTTTTYGLIGLD